MNTLTLAELLFGYDRRLLQPFGPSRVHPAPVIDASQWVSTRNLGVVWCDAEGLLRRRTPKRARPC